jgi:hypothetical protein
MSAQVMDQKFDHATGLACRMSAPAERPSRSNLRHHRGAGPFPYDDEADPRLVNDGKQSVSVLHGACFFDSALSFAMIRGGHVDAAVLGGMHVGASGDLANWNMPGALVKGIGGAMDIAVSKEYQAGVQRALW